jgi:two-component system response regulator YesN
VIKTIIADDEIWICKLLNSLIDWGDYGYTVVGNAHSGTELFEMIKNLQPQLVFSDIRMPGMDGIEVIRKVKDLKLNTHFVIISGYNDFEYAQSAIRLGIVEYLLKPVEKNELENLLIHIRNNVLTAAKLNSGNNFLQVELEKSRTKLLEHYFQSILLQREGNTQPIDIQSINNEYGSNFKEGLFQVVCICCDEANESAKSFSYQVVENVVTQCYNIFSSLCYEVCVIHKDHIVTCILNYSQLKSLQIDASFKSILCNFWNGSTYVTRFNITIGIGVITQSLSEIRTSYYCSKNSIYARIKLGVNRILDLTKNEYKITSPSQLLSQELQQQIKDFIKKPDHSKIENLLENTFQSYIKNDDIHPGLMIYAAKYILDIAILYIASEDHNLFNRIHTDYFDTEIMSVLDTCKTIPTLIAYITKTLNELCTSTEVMNYQPTNIIELIKAYIDDHYNEDIQLNDIARYVYLNPKYVSDLFKSKTGVNFSKYLTVKRIKTAQKLLLDPRNRISDVSIMVGYSDTKYFSKLFKEYTGVSPAQYKKLF